VSADLIDIADSRKINWTNSIAFGLFHLGAVVALFVFSWHAFAVTVFLYWTGFCCTFQSDCDNERMRKRGERRNPLFAKRWFSDGVIVTCVRWYLRFRLSETSVIAGLNKKRPLR
jgi:hypothetical protein